MRTRGVLAIKPHRARLLLVPEQRRHLDTFAALTAVALERVHYVEIAQQALIHMESERLRNSLLSALSHDLRTPLAALVGLADALRLTPPAPNAAQLEIIDAMRDSALRMNALVVNLLDMARLESGAVPLNRQWQPIEEVLGSAIAAVRPVLGERPVQVRLPEGMPLLQIDATLIERVIVNLLENAAKYTPAGSAIEIGARLDSEAVHLHVDDHGPGLPQGREEAIFQKFERGRRESATAGVGLGLAICRAILSAHGGSIRAENRPGGGARFVITLPRGSPPHDVGADESEAAAPRETAR
jgi:two-component system sensor histidine kinase KdpD